MPVNVLEAQRIFGDPRTEKYIVTYTIPKSLRIPWIPNAILCNEQFVKPFETALTNLFFRKLGHEVKSWEGCFNIRQKKGSASYSLHSWGLAVDINSTWNGYKNYPSFSEGFVKCFTDAGFIWGGNWENPEGNHFEIAEIHPVEDYQWRSLR